jgi:hypothetical protein
MNEPIKPDWKWGTAEGSRELDRKLDRRLTFREKLEWLEEAETLSLNLQAARMSRQAKQLRVAEEPADDRTKEQIIPNE